MTRKTDETWAKVQGLRILLENAKMAVQDAKVAERVAYEDHCAAYEAELAEKHT